MTRQEVVAKAQDLMAPILGASATRELIQSVYTLETLGEMRAWSTLLKAH